MTDQGSRRWLTTAGKRAQPIYFGGDDDSLFGWYHPPATKPRNAAVIICAPFGVEAIFAHRALRHIAEGLAHAGFPVLRYDHRDTADSPGSGVTPGRVGAWIKGVGTALDAARALSGARESAIVGLRFGATLAGVAAASIPGGIDSIAMWAPIASGRRYARELRAFSQVGSAPQEGGVGGFFVAPDTLADMESVDLLKLTTAPARRVLLVPRDDLPDNESLSGHFNALGAETQVAPVPGYAAAVAEPHRTAVPEAVIGAITSWLVAAHPHAERVRDKGPGQALESIVLDDVDGVKESALVSEHATFLDPKSRLFGVLTEPVRIPPRETGILLVNAGAVPRIGPQRLYVTMAREWATSGFRILRMDIGGIGDSLPAPGIAENETYPSSAVDDVVVGIDALRRAGCKKVVVAGLCSGAHTAFHLAIERPKVTELAGVVLINPIVFYWKAGDALDVGAWQNYVDARRYERRVWSSGAWRKAFRGEVDFGAVVGTFARRGATVLRAAITRVRARMDPGKTGNLARDLLAITDRSVDVMMVFSEGDPGFDQLNLSAKHVLGTLKRRPGFGLSIVTGADHTFTQIDAQRRVRGVLADYLTKRFA